MPLFVYGGADFDIRYPLPFLPELCYTVNRQMTEIRMIEGSDACGNSGYCGAIYFGWVAL